MTSRTTGSTVGRLLAAPYLALAAILLAASALRIFPLTYSHFWDEAVFLQHAKVMLDGRSNYDEFFHRPPLLSVLYATGFLIVDSIYVANIVQGVVTSLAVVFAFLYMRRLFGVTAALFAAALFAFMPYLAHTSHDLLTDGPALTLMLCAMWLYDKPGVRFAVLAGVAYSLAIQTRYTSLFLGLYFLLDTVVAPQKARNFLAWGVAAAAALAPYLLWNQFAFGWFLHPFAIARRIVTEWTAPMPASFYFDALAQIFPITVWGLFAIGVFGAMAPRIAAAVGSRAPAPALAADPRRRCLVLLTWGVAFFAYMLLTPHKEVRYLLPLAIPVLVIAATGAHVLIDSIARLLKIGRATAAALVGVIIAIQFSPVLSPLRGPLIDRSKSNEVQIAEYLRDQSTASDTVYAAHNFPVYAFYSERKTVSLLPIQADFDEEWREVMSEPGLLVYTHPDRLGEIHSIDTSLKPDRAFIEAHPEFRRLREFPNVTVYRYTPGVQKKPL